MDEMDRNIQLRSAERGYKAAILCLCAWTLFNSYQTIVHDAVYEPWPSLILSAAVCVQSFSQIAMKQRMVAGDEEYKEPIEKNRILLVLLINFQFYFP